MSNSRMKLRADDSPSNSSRGKGLILETPYKPGFVDDADLESVKMAVDKELSDISNAFFQTTERTADTITRVDKLEITGETQYGDLVAKIETVDKVSKEGDKALAERVTTFEAAVNNEFGEVNGKITETNKVMADADKVLAEKIDSIVGSFEGNLGPLFAQIEEVHRISVTGDQALAESIAEAKVEFQTANATLSAAIKTEETARVTADEAMAKRVDTVSAEWKSADAELEKTFKGDIDLERVARELEQAVLDGKITAEEAERLFGDEDLLRQLIQEKLDRENADKEGLEQIKIVKAAVTTESEARASEDEALARQIDTVTAEYKLADKQLGDSMKESVTELKASIRTESLARADADSSLASQITVIEAGYKAGDKTVSDKIDKNLIETNAAIKTESIARSDADGALGKRVDTVTANYKAADKVLEGVISGNAVTADAAVKSEATARADADGALGRRIDSVKAEWTSADAELSKTFTGKIDKERVDRELAIAVQEGKITQEQADRIAKDETLLRDLIQEKKDRESGDKTNADKITQVAASVTTESTARADADKALAAQITTVSAEWKQGDKDALLAYQGEIDKERVARELADAVAEGKITQAQADLIAGDEKLLRDLIAEQQARANGDKDNADKIEVVRASVVTETNARASQDAALASQITTASSQLNGTIASVQQTLQTNINAVDGKVNKVNAKWGISVDAGGNVAGIELNSSNTGGSEFRVRADRFIFTDGNTAIKPVSIQGAYAAFNNVIIREDCIVLGTLYADKIVGLPTGKSFGPNYSTGTQGWVQVYSGPLPNAEGRFNVGVMGSVRGTVRPSSGVTFGMQMFIDGVLKHQEGFNITGYGNQEYPFSMASPKILSGSRGGTLVIKIGPWSVSTNQPIGSIGTNVYCNSTGFLYQAIDA